MNPKRDRRGRFAPSRQPKPPTARLMTRQPKPKVITPKTISVKARNGNREIPTTHIAESSRWVFRNGQCFSLAIVLAEENNTDVGLLVEGSEVAWGTHYDDPDLLLNLDHDWLPDTIHTIALTEDSAEDETLTLDIDGPRDMGAIREEFEDLHSGSMIRIKPADLRNLLSKHRRGTGFYEPDYESATLIAPLIPRD